MGRYYTVYNIYEKNNFRFQPPHYLRSSYAQRGCHGTKYKQLIRVKYYIINPGLVFKAKTPVIQTFFYRFPLL